jgi:hypothetical protein
METVIENKINKLFQNLKNVKYFNPFINSKNLFYAKKIGMRLIPESMGFNGCSALGFFDNRLCEIITNKNLSEEQVKHLDKLLESWNFQPFLILINSITGKVIDVQKYEKIKINSPDNNWVAASNTRNYMLDDPILDYLKYNSSKNEVITKKRKRDSSERASSETFLEHIFENGNKFETLIVGRIKSMVKHNEFIEIGKSYEARNLDNYLKTLNAIKQGVPIIYQPVLWNSNNKTFGCADLIVKSSFASKIFPSYSSYSKLDSDLYEVYDVKCSNLKLKSDFDSLLNEIAVKPYKAQLWIYTDALNKMQSTKATRGFLIGKNYYREKTVNKKLTTENYSDPFEKLALVDFNNYLEEANIEKTIEAINWIKEVKKNKRLRIDPPNDSRLYPNMKNTQDNEFHYIKKELAEKNKELTLIFSVGKKGRDLALENGISKYDDPNLSATILGFNPETKVAGIVNNILDINRLETKLISRKVWPNNQEKMIAFNEITNLGNWKNSKVKCYVDIETINTSVYKLNTVKSNFIFMIGLGVIKDDVWSFYVFTANSLDLSEENRVISEFEQKLLQIEKELLMKESIPIFHWSNYENINLKPFLNINECYKFYDMCKWFKDCGICIKGSLDFKLKNITRALNKNKLTQIMWDDNVSGGLDAMNLAYNYYKSNLKNPTALKDIEYYNEIDCKSMSEIHNILNKI